MMDGKRAAGILRTIAVWEEIAKRESAAICDQRKSGRVLCTEPSYPPDNFYTRTSALVSLICNEYRHLNHCSIQEVYLWVFKCHRDPTTVDFVDEAMLLAELERARVVLDDLRNVIPGGRRVAD